MQSESLRYAVAPGLRPRADTPRCQAEERQFPRALPLHSVLRALAARVAPGISTSSQNQASRLQGITHSKASSVLAHAPHKSAHARAGRESATATYLLAAVEVLLPHTTHAHEPVLRVFDAHEPDELAHVGFLEHVEPVLWQPLHQHHLGIELCRSCPRHTSGLRPCALCVLSVLSYAFRLH